MGCWRLLKHNCRQWAALAPPERRMLIYAFFLLPVAQISRWMSFRRLQRLLGNIPRISRGITDGNTTAFEISRQAARMVSIAAVHGICRSTCLDRSLALWALLRCQGIDSDLHLGVRKDQGNFEAHAWVEIDGRVINDTDDVRQRFSPFSIPITAPSPYFR
jgi:hypothetical protein